MNNRTVKTLRKQGESAYLGKRTEAPTQKVHIWTRAVKTFDLQRKKQSYVIRQKTASILRKTEEDKADLINKIRIGWPMGDSYQCILV